MLEVACCILVAVLVQRKVRELRGKGSDCMRHGFTGMAMHCGSNRRWIVSRGKGSGACGGRGSSSGYLRSTCDGHDDGGPPSCAGARVAGGWDSSTSRWTQAQAAGVAAVCVCLLWKVCCSSKRARPGEKQARRRVEGGSRVSRGSSMIVEISSSLLFLPTAVIRSNQPPPPAQPAQAASLSAPLPPPRSPPSFPAPTRQSARVPSRSQHCVGVSRRTRPLLDPICRGPSVAEDPRCA